MYEPPPRRTDITPIHELFDPEDPRKYWGYRLLLVDKRRRGVAPGPDRWGELRSFWVRPRDGRLFLYIRMDDLAAADKFYMRTTIKIRYRYFVTKSLHDGGGRSRKPWAGRYTDKQRELREYL